MPEARERALRQPGDGAAPRPRARLYVIAELDSMR